MYDYPTFRWLLQLQLAPSHSLFIIDAKTILNVLGFTKDDFVKKVLGNCGIRTLGLKHWEHDLTHFLQNMILQNII